MADGAATAAAFPKASSRKSMQKVSSGGALSFAVTLRDSGLVHALLDLGSWNDVLGHPIVGPSWEGFVIENLITAAGDRRTPYYYRTEDGAEIDLLFERGGRADRCKRCPIGAQSINPSILAG